MKKLVILSFIGLLIMAFGITAYAQAPAPVLEFKASGFIDVISELNMNVPNPGWGTGAGATSRNDVLFGPLEFVGQLMKKRIDRGDELFRPHVVKATLMHLMGCLDTPSGGSYRLDGPEVAGLEGAEPPRFDDALHPHCPPSPPVGMNTWASGSISSPFQTNQPQRTGMLR